MNRVALMTVLLIVVSVFISADEKHPYTIEDHLAMKRLGSPAVSPDGEWIAYTQTEYSIETNKGTRTILLVPTKGGEPVFLAEGSSPVWSPDGDSIAFSRDGQIWVISMKGGEAEKVTDMATNAGGAKWSPCGKKLLFTSMVWPGLTLEETNRKLKEVEDNPVKAFTTESLLFRHWDHWRSDGRQSHLFILDLESKEVTDLVNDFAYDIPPGPFGGSGDYSFSPDGKEIAFVAKVAPNPAWHTNLDVFVYSMESKTYKNITEANKAQDSGPVVYSPDGKYLAYGAMERPGFEADRIQLMLYDRANGTHFSLTENVDLSMGDWIWLPESDGLYLTAEEKARRPIFKVMVADKKFEKVVEGHTNGGIKICPMGKAIFFTRQSLSHPVDIWRHVFETGEEVNLTKANDELLSTIEMGKVEEVYIKGAMDEDVQMFIIYPPGFDKTKKYPGMMLIHGGPQGTFGDDFHYRWSAQLFAAPGYVTTCINFHGSTSFGQAFTDSISRNWGSHPYYDIMQGFEYLAAFDFVDESKIGAAGASYGGYMIDWIATQTDKFAALVTHSGVYNLESMYGSTEELWFPEWEQGGPYWENREDYEKFSPHRFAANLKKHNTPVFVIHSQHDYRVPVTQGFELYTALQRQGVPSRLMYYPDETHFVAKPKNAKMWYDEVHAWFERWLKSGE